MEEVQRLPGGLSQPQPQPSSASTLSPTTVPVVAAGGTAMERQPSNTAPPSHNEFLLVGNEQPAIIPTEPQAYLPPPSSVLAGPPPSTAPPNWSVPGTALPSTLPAPPATDPDPHMPESQNASPVSKHIHITPTPLEQPGNLASNGANAALYRPLNVKDALSYLEMVKIKFHDKPDVYNHFLDIMKDFKSQTIDTPGVIDRISRLFTGHPSLIQGFNTFLPQGYRIDCSGDGPESTLITVTTPSGTTTQTADGLIRAYTPPHPSGISNGVGMESSAHSPHPSTPGVASLLVQTPSAAASPQDQSGAVSQDSKRPVEFGHAINYVNRIKNRFANDPGTYKQFLEILQTYQKEQRPIRAVYDQVTQLFNNNTDLLEGFGQFLPDPSNGGQEQSGGLMGLMQASGSSERITRTQDQPGAVSQGSKRPIEFGHAINFVNRIKDRFANDPDIYKQFLGILQTYQKEQRPIRAVYDQVTQLFNNNTDLLEEFKLFLPDPSNGGQEQSGGLMGPMQASGPSEGSSQSRVVVRAHL